MDELKSCPWCGSNGKIIKSGHTCWIHCSTCFSLAPHGVHSGNNRIPKAIKAWNARYKD